MQVVAIAARAPPIRQCAAYAIPAHHRLGGDARHWKGQTKCAVERLVGEGEVGLQYLPGHEPTFWHPDPSERTHRFALGHAAGSPSGATPLVAIGMNPSYADEQVADKTVNRIIRASVEHGYSGWVMLNLYPERATKSKDLRPYDATLSAANCAAIAEVVEVHVVTEVLGAWGGLAHATIRRAKKEVLVQLATLSVRLFSFDTPTSGGEPRHPTPRTGPLAMLGPKRYLT